MRNNGLSDVSKRAPLTLIGDNVTVDLKRVTWVWFLQKATHSLPSSVKYYSSWGGGGGKGNFQAG